MTSAKNFDLELFSRENPLINVIFLIQIPFVGTDFNAPVNTMFMNQSDPSR